MLSNAEADVMQLLAEDDYGLWEIAWRLGSIETAVPVVERLCRRGWAELFVRDWDDAEPVPVDRSGRDLDLRNRACWEEPRAGDSQLLIGATDTGREAVARASFRPQPEK